MFCIHRYVIGFSLLITQIDLRATPHTIAYVNDHNTIVQLLENAGTTSDYVSI